MQGSYATIVVALLIVAAVAAFGLQLVAQATAHGVTVKEDRPCGSASNGACGDGVCQSGYTCRSNGVYCVCESDSGDCGGDNCNGHCPTGKTCIHEQTDTGGLCHCVIATLDACGSNVCGGKCVQPQQKCADSAQGPACSGYCMTDPAQLCSNISGGSCGAGACPPGAGACAPVGDGCACVYSGNPQTD